MNKIFTHSANCTMYVDKFRRFIKHIDLHLGPINRTNDENLIARMQISAVIQLVLYLRGPWSQYGNDEGRETGYTRDDPW